MDMEKKLPIKDQSSILHIDLFYWHNESIIDFITHEYQTIMDEKKISNTTYILFLIVLK